MGPDRRSLLRFARGWIGGFLLACVAVFVTGMAAHVLEFGWGSTGLAGRLVAAFAGRGLTAEAPVRLERYRWVARSIPEAEYHGGERVEAWPEIVLAWETPDGATHRLNVRGRANNSYEIPRYMAHFAGVFGLPWIDFALDDAVIRRLSFDPRRPVSWDNQPRRLSDEEERRLGYTWETWEVARATDHDVEQLALLWAAPTPRLTVRYDPDDPRRAWPGNLLDALAHPPPPGVVTWIESVVALFVGGLLLWWALRLMFPGRFTIAAIVWVIAFPTSPLWTPHMSLVTHYLGVPQVLGTVASRGVTHPISLHTTVVGNGDGGAPPGTVRWSIAPREGAELLSRLSLPKPRFSAQDLLERVPVDLSSASRVVLGYTQAVHEGLLALPDGDLEPLLFGLCSPHRPTGFITMLRPAFERLAADSARGERVRRRARAFLERPVVCRQDP